MMPQVHNTVWCFPSLSNNWPGGGGSPPATCSTTQDGLENVALNTTARGVLQVLLLTDQKAQVTSPRCKEMIPTPCSLEIQSWKNLFFQKNLEKFCFWKTETSNESYIPGQITDTAWDASSISLLLFSNSFAFFFNIPSSTKLGNSSSLKIYPKYQKPQ